MTETSHADARMAEGLAELEGAEPVPDTTDGDYQEQVDRLIAKWRAWIDDMRVQLDLGRMDVRDEAESIVSRLENAWLSLKNEAERAGADAGSSVSDLRRDAGTLLGDLRRAAANAVERLRQDR